MSIESFRRLDRNDMVKMVREKNQKDKISGMAYDPIHTLALILKTEGTDGLSHRKIREEKGIKTDNALNHAAIVFGVSMKAIQTILKDGVFDSYEFISYYNEALVGVTGYQPIDAVRTEPEIIPEEHLRKIRRYAMLEKTKSVFFTTKAYDSLPEGLRILIDYTNTNKINTLNVIKNRLIPIYKPWAELFAPKQTSALAKIPEPAGVSESPILSREDKKNFDSFLDAYYKSPSSTNN